MDHVLTLVAAAPNGLTNSSIDLARRLTGAGRLSWLAAAKAADLVLSEPLSRVTIETLWAALAPARIDVFTGPAAGRRKKLLLADMDATIVAGETLDDLAAAAGCADEVAAITARGMRGELDFAESLRLRMALLRGVSVSLLNQVRDAMTLNPGAIILTATMAAHGATCVLVSGGATFFTAAVAARAGFRHHHGNVFAIADGVLTGAVAEPLLDKHAKRRFLQDYLAGLRLNTTAALAIGDGANDLPMLQAAGLGIGYNPKPPVRGAVANCIIHGDLTAALYAQGYATAEITT